MLKLMGDESVIKAGELWGVWHRIEKPLAKSGWLGVPLSLLSPQPKPRHLSGTSRTSLPHSLPYFDGEVVTSVQLLRAASRP